MKSEEQSSGSTNSRKRGELEATEETSRSREVCSAGVAEMWAKIGWKASFDWQLGNRWSGTWMAWRVNRKWRSGEIEDAFLLKFVFYRKKYKLVGQTYVALVCLFYNMEENWVQKGTKISKGILSQSKWEKIFVKTQMEKLPLKRKIYMVSSDITKGKEGVHMIYGMMNEWTVCLVFSIFFIK